MGDFKKWLLIIITSVLFGKKREPFIRLFLLLVVPLALALAALVIWMANSGGLQG